MIKCQITFPWNGLVAAVVLVLSHVESSFAQEPPPAEPTEETEVRDLSEPPLRTVKASFSFYGSSAEFVGEFGFWKTTKCMKQGDPEQFEASIAVGFSHTQIDA